MVSRTINRGLEITAGQQLKTNQSHCLTYFNMNGQCDFIFLLIKLQLNWLGNPLLMSMGVSVFRHVDIYERF